LGEARRSSALDGGKIHVEATDIAVAQQGTPGTGSINVTCD
jgi:hypothetical protein